MMKAFVCNVFADEEIDKLMYGEAPKAMPTRYSRYGHQVRLFIFFHLKMFH